MKLQLPSSAAFLQILRIKSKIQNRADTGEERTLYPIVCLLMSSVEKFLLNFGTA